MTRSLVQQLVPDGSDLIGIPAELLPLAAAQSGVATRRQVTRAGLDDRELACLLRARRWRTMGHRVVVMHNAALTLEQREWVAVLLTDKPCALAGLSGAAAGGLHGFPPDRVHIVVPHDTQVHAPSWVKVHESRRFAVADIAPAGGGPPRTGLARSVIDAAAWTAPPRRACAILCASVQQRLTSAARLGTTLQAAGRVRHAAIMRDILGDIGGGGHTLAEIDLGPLARRAGLSPPRRQALRRDPSGRIRYIDAEFVLPDGTILAVEVDGAGHLETEQWDDDLDRGNEFAIGAASNLRFSSLRIRLDPARVTDQLARMRAAHSPAELSAPRAV